MVNPYKRQFLISWISVLASVPDIDMLQYLSELLEGLMGMLSDPNREIRQATGKALQVCLTSAESGDDHENMRTTTGLLLCHFLFCVNHVFAVHV